MDETGYSWPEAILTLAVMMLIFGTLLPVSFRMMTGLESKKHEMYAKETMYQGALLHRSYGLQSGYRKEDGVLFSWTVEGTAICVSYMREQETRTVCSS
ncbi:hypothetical protein [Sporosarcina trichiuri]|uniref:hypothetical protein n=1 Tax=Sporosarcina trichiuri TaxID=3056445 RepID=UPI0025B4069A|nr:hypothetical protein [Sporosarcina sp. 0.2-SM1T-5]WJY28456.1 hypothetical protein QWT68_05595 [Sporosarcina sp. 0.2-SM1T-5]